MQQNLTSTKFAYISSSIKKMLEPLKSDQTFLRMIKYMSDYPLELQYFSDDGVTTFEQPDIEMPCDLIGNKDVLLTLFNPSIVVDEKIYIFFSHLHFTSYPNSAIVEHTFVMDVVLPYHIIQMGDKLRTEIIADEICKCIDNQNLADIGRCYVSNGDEYVVNSTYQGFRLFIKADNRRF